MISILYIADISYDNHNFKWIKSFSSKTDFKCYVIQLKHQHSIMSIDHKAEIERSYIKLLGCIKPISIIRFWQLIFNLLYFTYIIYKHNISIIHILYAEPNALWSIFRRFFSKPIILTTRGTDILYTIPYLISQHNLRSRYLNFFYTQAFKNVDIITCTSQKQKAIIELKFKRTHNISIVRTGVDFQRINNSPNFEILPILRQNQYIFFPRNMQPVYNHELAINAIELLPDPIKKRFLMLFVNKDSNNLQYVEYVKHRMDFSKGVKYIFLDSLKINQMLEYIKHSSLIVITNKHDGTPVTALESMALRKPLILPPLDYDEDLFKHVLKFEEFNEESLKESIIHAITDSYYSRDRLDWNYQAVYNYGNREKEMKKIEKLYLSSIVNNYL